MSNCNYNKQTANQRGKASVKKRVKKNMGGSMNARADMRSGYYPSDMGMEGGAMYKKGGPVKKPIPAGKKGKGIRALKAKAPQVAKRMGYKKGKKVK